MAVEKDDTAITLLRLLYKTSGKANTKKLYTKKLYPKAIENSYRVFLQNCFKPLIDYINDFLSKYEKDMLRGDSVRCDELPGGTFNRLVQELEGWLSLYMPTTEEKHSGQGSVIISGLNTTARKVKNWENKQFQKQLHSALGVEFQPENKWWEQVREVWTNNNYNLIVSNARNFVDKINAICENGITGGWSVKQLQQAIKKATFGLSENKCRLLARDQIGKLQGQITQAEMTEIGLGLYVWSTSGDERVRSTHIPLDDMLCRWDDADVYSDDGGKTWKPRPSTVVHLSPGQDIQCRCVALMYLPELLGNVGDVKASEELANKEVEKELVVKEKEPSFLSELKKIFNWKKPKGTISERMEDIVNNVRINPKYMDSVYGKLPRYKYTTNCQRCVPTFQMRLMGFDVRALGKPKKNIPYTDLAYIWDDWLRDKNGKPVQTINVFKDLLKSKSGVGGKELFEATMDYLLQQPDESVFQFKCVWRSGGGHTFAGYKSGGKIGFYDPQTNTKGGYVTNYFIRMKIDKLELVRMDDKVFDVDRIKECCENVGKKKK